MRAQYSAPWHMGAGRRPSSAGGEIVVQNDVVSTSPDDDAIANYDGAECLVPSSHCLVAKRPRRCEVRSFRFLGRLYDGTQIVRLGACHRRAPYLIDWRKKQRGQRETPVS